MKIYFKGGRNMTEELSKLTPRLDDALQLAYNLHGHDSRKSSNVPVMAHLLAVCSLAQMDGGDEDEAIAGLLHDALEDKPLEISRPEVEKQFGKKVIEIIEISTDTPKDYKGGQKPPWRERKEAYLDHASRANPDLLRVTVADKIDNARAILADYRRIGDLIWERFNAPQVDQIWYYQKAIEAYKKAGFKSPLLDELEGLVMQLSQLPTNNNVASKNNTSGFTIPTGGEC